MELVTEFGGAVCCMECMNAKLISHSMLPMCIFAVNGGWTYHVCNSFKFNAVKHSKHCCVVSGANKCQNRDCVGILFRKSISTDKFLCFDCYNQELSALALDPICEHKHPISGEIFFSPCTFVNNSAIRHSKDCSYRACQKLIEDVIATLKKQDVERQLLAMSTHNGSV